MVLVTWWNGLPVVTYIIRPIRVSNETCRLFHQHTRPIVFLLLLIRGVSQKSSWADGKTFCSMCTFKTHYRDYFIPSGVSLCPLHWSQQGCICFSIQLASLMRRRGEAVYNKSIYLPMLVGPVLTAVDESFYKAFCGERRWCLTSLGRMEWPRTMA